MRCISNAAQIWSKDTLKTCFWHLNLSLPGFLSLLLHFFNKKYILKKMEEVQNGPSNIHENVNIELIYEEKKSLKEHSMHCEDLFRAYCRTLLGVIVTYKITNLSKMYKLPPFSQVFSISPLLLLSFHFGEKPYPCPSIDPFVKTKKSLSEFFLIFWVIHGFFSY